MRFISVPLLLVIFWGFQAKGQDTLPSFSAVLKSNGKVIISWRNHYRIVNQISIQRSSDSLKNFTTLLTVPDPKLPENGFVDNRPAVAATYYRLFILLDKNRYIFSRSRKAYPELIAVAEPKQNQANEVEDSTVLNRVNNQRLVYLRENNDVPKPQVSVPVKSNSGAKIEVEKSMYIKIKDSVIAVIPAKMVRPFRDSVLSKTRDTLLFVHADTILIKPFVIPAPPEAKEVFKVSSFVFTAKDGNVNIVLSDVAKKKYSIKFMELDNSPLLEISQIRDAVLILDKSNFIHSGWFRFELYEDGKLKEKNKIFIPKDF